MHGSEVAAFSFFADHVLSAYSVTTLVTVIVAPIIALIFFSALAVFVFRRIHRNQMERLTPRDAEYGTIDGLIASNVGESTLAVSAARSRGRSLNSLSVKGLNCIYFYVLKKMMGRKKKMFWSLSLFISCPVLVFMNHLFNSD